MDHNILRKIIKNELPELRFINLDEEGIEDLLRDNDGLHEHIEYQHDIIERMAQVRDGYAKTLQDVCIELAKKRV